MEKGSFPKEDLHTYSGSVSPPPLLHFPSSYSPSPFPTHSPSPAFGSFDRSTFAPTEYKRRSTVSPSPEANLKDISPEQIIRYFRLVENRLHLSWSLRDVRRFLNRIYEFKDRHISNDRLIENVLPITTTDVALSFLLPGPGAGSERMEEYEFVVFLIFMNVYPFH
jgi:hypothetical protein